MANRQSASERDQYFRAMADAAPILIWVSDSGGQRTFFNRCWLEFTGRQLDQELGDGWTGSIHPRDLADYLKTYREAFDSRQPFTTEYRLRHHDGGYHWVQGNAAPYYLDSQFQGFIGCCTDIHEMKNATNLARANTMLKSQRAELVALNATKDEFISLASHQLRTPATGVKQYLGMLLEGYGGAMTEMQTNLLRTAYESNERQLNIIDDLLRVAHVDAGKVILDKKQLSITKLVKNVMREQFSTVEKRRQRMLLETEQDSITAKVDGNRLRMVLENILDNASKYSPEGSTITVRVSRAKGQVIIEIIDQGVGIAKEDIPKLFQKFSRVNNSLSTLVGGTGIGLYWAKKIIDLHGGNIKIESKLHSGTTFRIELPEK